MDYSLQNHDAYIGQSVTDLPTPALVISKPIVERNIAQLNHDVDAVGVAFRPHVKTLKCLEITRMMLRHGKNRKIIASTIPEIEGALPLVKEGLLDEAIYGLPIAPSKLPRLAALRDQIRIVLLLDHDDQVTHLESFAASSPWDVLIKIDVGTRRAGIPASSPRLAALVARVESSSAANLLGFYAHATHSYAGRTQDAAESYLSAEVEGVLAGARLLPADRPLLLSVGSTPTAHVVRSLRAAAPANVTIELHAGNFPCNDLQQVATGLVAPDRQALRLVAEVCSVYPERNEVLVNAGTVAVSKETHAQPGFGDVAGKPGWFVKWMSQEHGIVGVADGPEAAAAAAAGAEEEFKVGDKVMLHVAHACITAANHHAFYVVDEQDVVTETWIPWKGW
ncbi:D-serine dehydratase like protein [Verticillium longisporum]|uniref:D-serine dehydratase n=3 Tax=Verticillium TaxID=1036719 RepID=G2X7W5_VERDV|nr:uncharacterized protein VDAG_06573 [Verticillium dahliae VdLs.17]KAG7124965.1 D-serine dehydratase like protein [Verticillium longisporum]KAH6694449.1 putative serine dehydratase domain-containing protein [Verticillium dahliae]EGY15083.1 hypothetical protein VDAG_06573 [Verticillium dahliae VdLs.17]PNH27501.1 hypothetical protein BJF96_g9145 [Verticillium dahliae]PNH38991.1 hypothetical protein VD0004_g7864 [Verticillium dahliae]